MHEFIKSVTVRLGCVGLAQRAMTIFDVVMNKGKYRWGRRARKTAGAAIALAMRESNKADSLRDIGVRALFAHT
jgi:transcription factor IIIB subunit 2